MDRVPPLSLFFIHEPWLGWGQAPPTPRPPTCDASPAANSTDSSRPQPRRRGRRRYERRVLHVSAGRETDFIDVQLPPVLLPKVTISVSKTLLCVYGDELNTAVEKERNFLARGAGASDLEELLEAAVDGVPRCLLCAARDGQLLHPYFHSLSPIYT